MKQCLITYLNKTNMLRKLNNKMYYMKPSVIVDNFLANKLHTIYTLSQSRTILPLTFVSYIFHSFRFLSFALCVSQFPIYRIIAHLGMIHTHTHPSYLVYVTCESVLSPLVPQRQRRVRTALLRANRTKWRNAHATPDRRKSERGEGGWCAGVLRQHITNGPAHE